MQCLSGEAAVEMGQYLLALYGFRSHTVNTRAELDHIEPTIQGPLFSPSLDQIDVRCWTVFEWPAQTNHLCGWINCYDLLEDVRQWF